MGNSTSSYILRVKNLKKHFPVYGGIFSRQKGAVYAVDGVSFCLEAGKTLGIVGESGCGKTTLARTLIKLYKPTSGEIFFLEKNINKLSKKDLRAIRKNMQMIFQDPFESLNSRHTIKQIIEEPFIIHKTVSGKKRDSKIADLLNRVGLSKKVLSCYPHEFSGGQRQRIGIARALALNPKLIICDEPVSALDVSIQSQILNLLLDLQKEMKIAYVFIAHDLAVVKHVSDMVAVMYLGKIVEFAHADIIYKNPLHPYTKALISSIPVPDPNICADKTIVLEGDVPNPASPPSGCRFHTRCSEVMAICEKKEPELTDIFNKDGLFHQTACHLRTMTKLFPQSYPRS